MSTFLQKNMKKDDILKICDACGEIARGLKKIKAVLADFADGLSVVSSGQSVPVSGQSVPASGQNVPDKSVDLIKKFCGLPRFFLHRKFLTSRKTVWGKDFTKDCVRWLLQKDLRSDKFKNAWLDGVKISQCQYKTILVKCKLFLEDCQAIVSEHWYYTSFADKVGEIHTNRWERRQNITDAKMSLKDLNDYTRQVHAELPALRSHSRLKNK